MNVAVPPLIVLVPSVVSVPDEVLWAMKVTVPVAPAVTVAVSVTESPYKQLLSELARVVVLLTRFTVWLRGLLLLVA